MPLSIHLDQGEVEDFVEYPGKWQVCRHFHLKFEGWNKQLHGPSKAVKGFGRWIYIKILPLNYRSRQTFEAIASNFGGLVSLKNETLNIVNVGKNSSSENFMWFYAI